MFLRVHLSAIHFNLHLKWLATKYTRRKVYPKDTILLLFEREMIIRVISRQCFIYGHKLDHGNFLLQLLSVMLFPSHHQLLMCH